MKSFECRFCLNKIDSNEPKCTCSLCGREMHALPYDRKQELKKEVLEYFHLSQIKLDEKFEFNEVKKLIAEKKFPDYLTIYNAAFSKADSRKYITFLNTALESFENYLFNNLTSKTKISFDFLVEKTKIYDEVFIDLTKEIGLNFNATQITFPKTTAVLHYEKKVSLLDAVSQVLKNLKELLNKINKHVNLYNVNVFKNKKINKFTLKNTDTPIVVLENINTHLVKINNKKIVFDILNDGIQDYIEMNNAFWLAIYTLLEVSSPLMSVEYVSDNDKILIKEEINKKYECRYETINKDINEKLQTYSIESLTNLIDLFLEKNIYSKLKISSKSFLQIGKAEKKLNSLIGLKNIKSSVEKIKAYSIMNKDSKDLNIHMCFLGNPGTGKTEVARLIADILHENNILPTNKVIETDRSGLVSSYFGDTVNKTNAIIHKAMGGVLFIDEAYSLVAADTSNDYGHEAVAALIKAMEDYRGKFCVILAGYKNPMLKMIDTNPGFKSRIQFTLDFPDYSRDEMANIINLLLKNKDYRMNDNVLNKMLDIIDIKRKEANFANAREARNILDQLIMIQNLRVMDSSNKLIVLDDINKYILDNKIMLPTSGNNPTSSILTPEEELDELIGLSSIKKTIKKIKAYAKKNKDDSNFNMHMCFYGNPGTGKTEVARIISRLLYEAGVLPEAKMIETDKSGLVGKFIGHTEDKTKQLIDSALGGVLFIDEAYGLNEKYGSSDGFGKQALEVLLKEMEDKRGKFCVILAGYKNEMQELISLNPGFSSRIAFELEFPDFSREELLLICEKMISKKKYISTPEVISKIVDVTEYYKEKENFANARTLRNIIDQVIMNQNLRTEDEVSNEITLDDVLEYIGDEGIILEKNKNNIINHNEHLDEFFYNFIKTEIVSLSAQYQFMNKNIIDQAYINETVVSISGMGSQGTGFIISPSGLCITCNHCIHQDGANQKARIILKTYDNKEMKLYSDFKVIKRDEFNDIALIKLMSSAMIYKFLPLANSDYKFKPLLKFYTAGYPFGGETFDQVSFSEGQVASINLYNNRKVVFSNMFGKPGSSGSPIFCKTSNDVIGIYWGGISSPNGVDMINCFTSIDLIWELLNSF